MPEEKENAGKDKGEPSLEKQLLDLLQGLPSQPHEEQSVDKDSEEPGPSTGGDTATLEPGEPPQVSSEPPPPPNATLQAPNEVLSAADMNAPPGKQSKGQVAPGTVPSAPSPVPGVAGDGPAKSSDDAKRSPLAEEIGGLFGGAAMPAKPILPAPSKPSPAGPAESPASVRPHISEAGPALRGNGTQGFRPVSGVATPEPEAFAVRVLDGPKVGGGLGGLKLLERRTVSLSIEGTSLRIMTMSGRSVETWASVPLDPRLIREGYVANSNGVAETIARALKARKISAGRLVCAFTSLGAVHRILYLPETARKDLNSVVPRELRRATINPDAYSITWQVLDGRPGSIQVYVVGVPREPLLTFIDTLRLAGVKPVAIDLKPLALARAVNEKDAIIAHGETDSMELAIVVDAVPTLMRSIYLGSEAVPGLVAARLAEELERTVDFYNGTHRANPLSSDVPVYVTGEIANYPGLVDSLVAGSGRSLARLDPPLKLPKDFPLPLFMVNIGLLLKK